MLDSPLVDKPSTDSPFTGWLGVTLSRISYRLCMDTLQQGGRWLNLTLFVLEMVEKGQSCWGIVSLWLQVWALLLNILWAGLCCLMALVSYYWLYLWCRKYNLWDFFFTLTYNFNVKKTKTNDKLCFDSLNRIICFSRPSLQSFPASLQVYQLPVMLKQRGRWALCTT